MLLLLLLFSCFPLFSFCILSFLSFSKLSLFPPPSTLSPITITFSSLSVYIYSFSVFPFVLFLSLFLLFSLFCLCLFCPSIKFETRFHRVRDKLHNFISKLWPYSYLSSCKLKDNKALVLLYEIPLFSIDFWHIHLTAISLFVPWQPIAHFVKTGLTCVCSVCFLEILVWTYDMVLEH